MRVTDEVVEYRTWIHKNWAPKLPPRHAAFFHPLLDSMQQQPPPIPTMDNRQDPRQVNLNNDTAVRLERGSQEKGSMEELPRGSHQAVNRSHPAPVTPDNSVEEENHSVISIPSSPEALSSGSDTVSHFAIFIGYHTIKGNGSFHL